MKTELHIVRGTERGRVVAYEGARPLVVGRNPECDLTLADLGISGRHCAIERTGAVDEVVDLASRNGTYLNGRRIRRHPLSDGDVLQAGDAALQYRRAAPAPGARPTPAMALPAVASAVLPADVPWSRAEATICDRIPVNDQSYWTPAASPEDAAENRKLRRLLASVTELAALAHGPAALTQVLDAGLAAALDALDADRAALLLTPRPPGFAGLEVARARDAAPPSPAPAPSSAPPAPAPAPAPIVISRSIVDACLREGISVLTRFGEAGAALPSQSIVRAGIKSVLCVPIEAGGRTLGALYLDSLKGTENFRRGDLEILAGYAAFLAALVDRRILEGRVQATEHRLGYLLRYVPVGIFAVDAAGQFTLWNASCERLLGHAADAVVAARDLDLLLPSPEGPQATLAQVDATAGLVVERELVRADGSPFLGVLTLRRFDDPGGAAAGYVGLLEDVTERRTLRDELAREEKMATLGLLVAGVAHDFKNVLSPMMGFAELAQRRPESAPRLIEAVLAGTQQGLALTTALLRQARSGEDSAVPTDLGALLDAVVRLVHHELVRNAIEIRREYEPAPLAEVNPGLIQNVFLNLILNAREAMPQGGRLTLRVAAEQDRVSVSIADNGIGMSPETVARLTTPFFTTKSGAGGARRGVGLGLFTSRQTIEHHAGELRCVSEPGRGTTFTVALPVRAPGGHADSARDTPLPMPRLVPPPPPPPAATPDPSSGAPPGTAPGTPPTAG
ncbi:MAG: FHA domain-containing protein [Planctomycetes bacterium]|nr:FHA domain-containing protein [Planctomycetota bacterium]